MRSRMCHWCLKEIDYGAEFCSDECRAAYTAGSLPMQSHYAKEWGHPTPSPTASHCTCNPCCYDAGYQWIPTGAKVHRESQCQSCVMWVDGTHRCTLGCWR